MLYDELFGPWGRILLVGIGAGALLLVLLLMACFLTPGCIGHECLRRRWRKPNEAGGSKPLAGPDGNSKLGDVSYRSWRLGSLYDNGSICENEEATPKAVITPTHTHWDIKELLNAAKQKNEKKPESFPTELTLSLQFLPGCEDPRHQRGKFVIGIEAISGLPPKQYNCTVEPYVIVQIMKQSWTHRKRELLHNFRTRGIRHTASPIYRETFIIADVNSNEAKGWLLIITAHDQDRYANHTELCCLKIRMKEVEKIFCSPEIHLFNYKMKPTNQEFGSILLGICYLPTAQRLTFEVLKLRDVKYPALPAKTDFNPYVRILMLNGRTGRKMKKKKTRVLQSSAQPEIRETITFDLSFNQIDSVQFLIILCNKITPEEILTPDQPSDSEDSVTSGNRFNDVFIGKVAFGKGVRGTTERLHWFSMLQNPRKLITVWHTLK